MKTFYLFLALALFLPEECRDYHDGGDTGASDPSQLILGQWKEIACGNEINTELTPASLTIEFLPDGTYYGPYGFFSGVSSNALYRIESDSLYLYRETNPNDFFYIYRYVFTGRDQLKVSYLYGGIDKSLDTPTFHIYKRIKNQEK